MIEFQLFNMGLLSNFLMGHEKELIDEIESYASNNLLSADVPKLIESLEKKYLLECPIIDEKKYL